MGLLLEQVVWQQLPQPHPLPGSSQECTHWLAMSAAASVVLPFAGLLVRVCSVAPRVGAAPMAPFLCQAAGEISLCSCDVGGGFSSHC